MSKVAQQGIKPSSELKPQLLTIKRHRLLQKGSPQFPAGLTSTMHTSYLGRPPQNLLPPRFGFQTSPTAQKSPRAVGQPLLPARSPAPPGRETRAPPSPRALGHSPALPPPGPNRTAVGSGARTARRTGWCLPGPRPTRPPPGRCPVPSRLLTGSQRNRVHCPCPAPVPSSSRSNRPTPPAHAMTSRVPPLTRRRKD